MSYPGLDVVLVAHVVQVVVEGFGPLGLVVGVAMAIALDLLDLIGLVVLGGDQLLFDPGFTLIHARGCLPGSFDVVEECLHVVGTPESPSLGRLVFVDTLHLPMGDLAGVDLPSPDARVDLGVELGLEVAGDPDGRLGVDLDPVVQIHDELRVLEGPVEEPHLLFPRERLLRPGSQVPEVPPLLGPELVHVRDVRAGVPADEIVGEHRTDLGKASRGIPLELGGVSHCPALEVADLVAVPASLHNHLDLSIRVLPRIHIVLELEVRVEQDSPQVHVHLATVGPLAMSQVVLRTGPSRRRKDATRHLAQLLVTVKHFWPLFGEVSPGLNLLETDLKYALIGTHDFQDQTGACALVFSFEN